MANKGFGAKEINLVGVGTPTIDSPTDLHLDVTGVVQVQNNLAVGSSVTAQEYYGDGVNLVGIVTNLIPGIGIDLYATQTPDYKGEVVVESYKPIGKTIYVSQTGDDENTGLAENHPKRTIKAAASVAVYGDTIKVYPGVYVEENPIVLPKTVSVEGTELRNCVITPKYPNLDMLHVNNGCHITDSSFIGPNMTDGAAIVALQPLLGTAADRFFDGARMIRLNLDYIASEAVGFLTSGFSGFAGNHREQDAARLIDANIDFIAAEAVGFLTSPSGLSFTVPLPGTTEDCADDIKDIFRAISYDLKANSNRKSVGAALSYFNDSGALVHITGAGVSEATIATLNYAAGITTYIIDKQSVPSTYQVGIAQSFGDPNVIIDPNGCVAVGNTMKELVGIITSTIGAGNTSTLPLIRYGVMLEPDACRKDLKDIWKGVCFDITRGGNFRSVQSGKAYYDEEWNLIPQILKNPEEVEQTIATVDYSFNIARSIINNCAWGGYPSGDRINVTNALYDNVTGITTIFAANHGVTEDEVLLGTATVKVSGLEFTCPSGPGIVTYPSGYYGDVFPVREIIDENTFVVAVGPSTLPHTYNSGTGTIQKYGNFQNDYSQVKDLSMQVDYETGFNDTINGCANVISAVRSCVGVVTSILGFGSTAFSTIGFTTTYPGNAGMGFTTVANVIEASYDARSGQTTINAPELTVKRGDIIEVRDLLFSCSSNGISTSTQLFPSGVNGFEFYVDKLNQDGTFIVNVGVSTIPHDYVSGGIVVNRSVDVSESVYDHTTGICTITAPGSHIVTGDIVTLRDLVFSCSSGGAPSTQLFPSGAKGYTFTVIDTITDKKVAITSALYDNTTGITTISAPGIAVTTGELVEVKGLLFSCSSNGVPSTQEFPSGKFGYRFAVIDMIDNDYMSPLQGLI